MSWDRELIPLEDDRFFETLNGLWKGEQGPFVDAGVIRNTNFNESGSIDYSDIAWLPVEEKKFKDRKLIPGDVIIERSGGGPNRPVGRVVYFDRKDGNFSFSNFTSTIRVKDTRSFDHKFVFYRLMELYQSGQTEDLQRQTTNIRNLDFAAFKQRAQFPLLDVPEQQRIVQVLSTVQDAIAQQERLIRTTTELKQALLQKLFTEGLRGEAHKETEIGRVPESWEVVKLGSLADVISKGSSPNWQGFEYQESGVLFVRSQNVGDGQMDLADRVYLDQAFNQKERRSVLKKGDILVNLVGASIGRVALATDEVEGANCNQAVSFVRIPQSDALRRFLVNFLLSPAGQEQMRQQKKDIARANLSLLDVRNFLVPVPSTDSDIKQIAEAFTTLEAKLTQHEGKRDVLQDLFRTLLHELMTGRVRVMQFDN